MEPVFLKEESPNDNQDLVDDFERASVVVANITSAEEVMKNVSLGP